MCLILVPFSRGSTVLPFGPTISSLGGLTNRFLKPITDADRVEKAPLRHENDRVGRSIISGEPVPQPAHVLRAIFRETQIAADRNPWPGKCSVESVFVEKRQGRGVQVAAVQSRLELSGLCVDKTRSTGGQAFTTRPLAIREEIVPNFTHCGRLR